MKTDNLQYGPTEGRFEGEFVTMSVPRTFWDKLWQSLREGRGMSAVQKFRRVVIKCGPKGPVIFGDLLAEIEDDPTRADVRDHYDGH